MNFIKSLTLLVTGALAYMIYKIITTLAPKRNKP